MKEKRPTSWDTSKIKKKYGYRVVYAELDPKVFQNSQLLEQISYSEAIELAFYGASVIHPKTLQPLQKKRNTSLC